MQGPVLLSSLISPGTRATLRAFSSSQTRCLQPQGPHRLLLWSSLLPSHLTWSPLLPFPISAQKSFPPNSLLRRPWTGYMPLHAATPSCSYAGAWPRFWGTRDYCPYLLWSVSPRGQHLCLLCSVLYD